MSSDLSPLSILNFAYMIFVLLVSLSVHESAHGWVAERCGDNTARMLGRITLNPLKHLDPIWSVVLPLLLFIAGLPVIGAGKPVPVNPRNFRNYKLDNALVSAAGPVSNLMLALISTLSMSGYLLAVGKDRFWSELGQEYTPPALMIIFASINLLLMAFNAIPVVPLDGSHILEAILPGGTISQIYEKIKPAFFVLLIVLMLTPVLGMILNFVLNILLMAFVFFPLTLVASIAGQ